MLLFLQLPACRAPPGHFTCRELTQCSVSFEQSHQVFTLLEEPGAPRGKSLAHRHTASEGRSQAVLEAGDRSGGPGEGLRSGAGAGVSMKSESSSKASCLVSSVHLTKGQG